MQPGSTGWLDAVWEQRIVRTITAAAGKTESERRAHKVPVQPFDNAA
jgi:hypothetical protein